MIEYIVRHELYIDPTTISTMEIERWLQDWKIQYSIYARCCNPTAMQQAKNLVNSLEAEMKFRKPFRKQKEDQ